MTKKKRPSAGGTGPQKGRIARFPTQSPTRRLLASEVFRAVAIYSGQECLGHLLPHGRSGFEAFSRDDISIGIFPDQRTAANAVSKAAS